MSALREATLHFREHESIDEKHFHSFHGQEKQIGETASRAAGQRFAHGNDGTGVASGLEHAWEYSGRASDALDQHRRGHCG